MDDKIPVIKKHPCPDCDFCQLCSNTRCSMCRPKPRKKKKEDSAKKEDKPLFRT